MLDTDVRVGVQRASIERVRALLAQAEDLQQVVALESQLASREADLGSLQQTQAYLRDQTSRSTITVSLERTHRERPAERTESGFLAGLHAGWSALGGAGAVVATLAGVLLPWAVLLAVLAPAWPRPVARRMRRRAARTAAVS